MKFEKAFLHVGLDKTGSKAIQTMCNDNRELLESMGVLYPIGCWHAMFGSCFAQPPEHYVFNIDARRIDMENDIRQAEEDKYFKSIEMQINKTSAKNIVFSFEGFTQLNTKSLTSIHEYLLKIAGEVKIIMYCRDPISYAISATSQKAKHGRPSKYHVQFYLGICNKLIKIFGKENILIDVFSRDNFLNKDVRSDFLLKIGIEEESISKLYLPNASANPSLCNEAILLSEALQKLLDVDTSFIGHGLRFNEFLEALEGNKYYLTKEQYNTTLFLTAANMKYLEKTFSLKFNIKPFDHNYDKNAPIPPEFYDSLAKVIYDLLALNYDNHMGKISLCQNLISGHVSDTIDVEAKIFNNSSFIWQGDFNSPVYLSYHWYDDPNNSNEIIMHGEKTPLTNATIKPGSSIKAKQTIVFPDKPGNYLLVLTLLKKEDFWIEEKGFISERIKVEILAN